MLVSDRTAFAKKTIGALVTLDMVFELVEGNLSNEKRTDIYQMPSDSNVFVFCGKRRDLIKLLRWDGDGLCLFQKRLERGRFIWPMATSGTVEVTRAQLSMLLERIDWRQPQRTWEPQAAG
jgi:transposase